MSSNDGTDTESTEESSSTISMIKSSTEVDRFIENAVTNPNSDNDSDSDNDNDDNDESEPESRTSTLRGQKMREVLSLVGQYKHYLEIEKQEFERKMSIETEKVKQFERENEMLKEELENTIDEYEKKFEELNQEKVARTKENVETLQTLVNELTYIEEKNQELSDLLEQANNENQTLKKELDLSKQLIKQLELKVERANTVALQKIATVENKYRGSSSDLIEKEKMDKITNLVLQLKDLVSPEAAMGGGSTPAGANSLKMLWEEKEAHEKTKQKLLEEQQRAKDEKAKIQKLEKRVTDLLKSQTNTIRRLKDKSVLEELAAELGNAEPEYAPVTITNTAQTNSSVTPSTSAGNVAASPEVLRKVNSNETTTPNAAPLPTSLSGSFTATLRRNLAAASESTGVLAGTLSRKSTMKPGIQRRKTTLDLDRLTADEKVQRLFLYIEMNKLDDLEVLVNTNGFLINSSDEMGRTAIHKAARNAVPEIVNFLLKHGADYNKVDHEGSCALHYAALATTDSSEIFRSLLQKPDIKVNIPNSKKNLPIHLYVQSKYMKQDILVELIKRGSDLNYQNLEGDNVLICAVYDQHLLALVTLLKYGAPVNTPNAAGMMPLQIAAKRGAVRCAEALISYGAEVKTYRDEDVKKPKVATLKALDKRRSSKSVYMHKITVKTPDKKLKLQVDMSWKVSDVITILQQKVGGSSTSYRLFLDNQELDPEQPLSFYPKLEKEKEPLYYMESLGKKHRGSIILSGKRSKAFSGSKENINSTVGSTSPGGSSKEKDDKKSRRKSVVGIFVGGLKDAKSAVAVQKQTLSDREKKIVLAQSVVRMHLKRKKYLALVKTLKSRKEITLNLTDAARKHLKLLKKINKVWITPIEETLQSKVSSECLLLLASYSRLIAINEKFVKDVKNQIETPYYKLRFGICLIHLLPSMRLYESYGKQYSEGEFLLKEKSFTSVLATISKKPEDIAAFLAGLHAPVDHLTNLKKLVTELLKVTPNDHPDYQDFQKAIYTLNLLKYA